ncbi:Fe-S cluster assembly protein SufD [Halobacteriales archaeon QS_5_68_33]|nr:MAG: Fe-S cluster assembly protein SufD [Halobacteriales archaeon QS_5_68_33]
MSTQVHPDISEQQVRTISETEDEPEWLLETRLDALAALDELEMPEVIRTPGRTWTNLTDLDYETLVDPETQAEEKEWVDAEGAAVLPIHEAVEQHPELVEERFGSVVDPQRNYLTALSTALFTTGTVIHVPEGTAAEDVKIRTTMNSRSLFNYTLVVAEESAEVTILERQSTGEAVDGHRYYSATVEVVAGNNASVQYGSLQNLSEETYNYQVKRGHAADDASVEFIDGNIGSRLSKSSVETRLLGEGSESRIVGAFFGHDEQHFDIASRVWHENEHTTADLVTRGVLDDEARSVYEGVQDVGSAAWDTSSYQRENTLMLSDESEADASPKLIINNHDTEASHSATVGQVDDEELFYMTSRGLDPERATDMLVEGFFVPVLEEVAVDELREDLEDLVAERLRN